ncbi:uncharacterized protein LOC62_01G001531 [Vanrija pseudolonga]|uniref:Uncharacterized protein n=1 Tax=Vanrija pseudolonga TaxID=143232 RepID=A0AAF0Y4L2_9TREE|nr:hypothetical protein LOC62_01G001531 [Vanrija pseudolonga]
MADTAATPSTATTKGVTYPHPSAAAAKANVPLESSTSSRAKPSTAACAYPERCVFCNVQVDDIIKTMPPFLHPPTEARMKGADKASRCAKYIRSDDGKILITAVSWKASGVNKVLTREQLCNAWYVLTNNFLLCACVMSGLKRAWADGIFLGNAERDAGECRTQAWRIVQKRKRIDDFIWSLHELEETRTAPTSFNHDQAAALELAAASDYREKLLTGDGYSLGAEWIRLRDGLVAVGGEYYKQLGPILPFPTDNAEEHEPLPAYSK